MNKRKLGKSGIEVSALGMGCWAIGGPNSKNGLPGGWGKVDDHASVRALHCGLELGITLLDTADSYGGGHSEEVLGKALEGRRDKVILATKYGSLINKLTPAGEEPVADEEKIRASCEASLKRLQTDYIDLYQLHLATYPVERVPDVLETLEKLVEEGKIRWYGWSTDNAERVRAFARGDHCAATQQRLNVMEGDLDCLQACEETGQASLNRSPLVMGLLTGKFTKDSEMAADDIRSRWWNFKDGNMDDKLAAIEKLKELLTAGGRSMVQGALAWLWAKSAITIPIPGFKTVAQVEENIKALEKGPLPADVMENIENLKASLVWD